VIVFGESDQLKRVWQFLSLCIPDAELLSRSAPQTCNVGPKEDQVTRLAASLPSQRADINHAHVGHWPCALAGSVVRVIWFPARNLIGAPGHAEHQRFNRNTPDLLVCSLDDFLKKHLILISVHATQRSRNPNPCIVT
jgi:hypothetical protein